MKLLRPYPKGTRVLLHICCAPDAAHGVPAMLAEGFRVTGHFFNPNIQPAEEYARRLDATRQLQAAIPFPLVVEGGFEAEWEEAVRGLEHEKERGKRCEACVRLRLRRTAEAAREAGCDAIASVLTVSRLKSARMVNPIGKEEAARAGVAFIDADMGKNDGYNDSVRVTTRLGIYRQDYCGCRFSIRKVKSAGENAEEQEMAEA